MYSVTVRKISHTPDDTNLNPQEMQLAYILQEAYMGRVNPAYHGHVCEMVFTFTVGEDKSVALGFKVALLVSVVGHIELNYPVVVNGYGTDAADVIAHSAVCMLVQCLVAFERELPRYKEVLGHVIREFRR